MRVDIVDKRVERAEALISMGEISRPPCIGRVRSHQTTRTF